MTLGNNASALGTYTLSGGSVGTVNEWVGNLGVGYFVQSSGTNTATSSIVIANSAGSVGNYTLNNGSISSTAMQVANAGTGNFMQLGGLNAVSGWLTIGNTAGSYGTYTMLGGGLSVAPISGGEVVGNSGTGIFTQNKGTNTIGSANGLTLGSGTGSFGMYTLGPDPSCLLTGAANEIIGQAGTGIFIQTGGSNLFAPGSTTEGFLYIGNSGGNGTYSLSGSGQLNTTREFIGADQNGKKTGTGQFLQTGGTSNDSLNFTAGLVIGPSSRYVLGGGTLTVVDPTNNTAIGFFTNSGTFDGNNQAGTFETNTFVDLTTGTWVNLEDMNFIGGANCLLVLPKGASSGNYFGSIANAGVTYTLGSPLVINRKTLTGSINVQDQTQVINGTLQISSFAGSIINLNNGLVLTGLAGTNTLVNLGGGSLTVNDTTSVQSGFCTLDVTNQYIACSGTQPVTQPFMQTSGSLGSFAQSGGTNNIAQDLDLGCYPLDNGTYKLSLGTTNAASLLNVGDSVWVGYGGTGTFTQTGGTNYVANGLTLGNVSGGLEHTP